MSNKYGSNQEKDVIEGCSAISAVILTSVSNVEKLNKFALHTFATFYASLSYLEDIVFSHFPDDEKGYAEEVEKRYNECLKKLNEQQKE